VSVEYLDLTDYLAIAAEITGLDLTTLTTVTHLSLADSALHAPAAGFADVDLYPDFVDKAAVLLVRLTKNHPLPDGNKRAAWLSMRMFVAVNGWTWHSRPDIDDAEATVVAIAAGELDEAGTAEWLRQFLAPPQGAA
jgi:death-on-curing protein